MDPFTMWKEMYEKTEATWSNVIHESMKKDSFSQNMGQTLNSHLQTTELVSGMADAYLKQLNMPTRDEIASLASLIINLEEKVDDLQDNMEEETLKNNTSNEISQLRSAVSNLDEKLDKILEVIELSNEKKKAPTTKGK